MAYLVDANVFMQAKNLHYGFDFCPAFWDWLIRENGTGSVFSIEKVGDEIRAGNDDLSAWAAARDSRFFIKPDLPVTTALANVSNWVASGRYEQMAVNAFLQVADYYLVAHALAHGHTVVTHEKPENSKRKVKIPNVCIGLGIKCMTPFEMLRVERAKFVLGRS